MAMLAKGLTVQGSAVGSRLIIRSMLEFASLHDIKPVLETFPMTEEGAKEALDRLERGESHFRCAHGRVIERQLEYDGRGVVWRLRKMELIGVRSWTFETETAELL
jgi:hypothetical protein